MASISVPFLSSRAFPSHSAKTHLLHFIISQRSPSLFSNQNFTKASSSSRISIGKGFQSSGMPLISAGLLRRKVQAQGEYSSGDEAVPFDSEDIAQEAFAWSSVILPFLFPALGGLLFGYDIGATSGATISLQSAELSGTTWFNLSTIELGLVVSGSLYGALLGSLLVYPIADFLGRRRELIAAAVLYMLGALVTGTASNLGILILGRLLYGIGIGLVSVTFFVRYA